MLKLVFEFIFLLKNRPIQRSIKIQIDRKVNFIKIRITDANIYVSLRINIFLHLENQTLFIAAFT